MPTYTIRVLHDGQPVPNATVIVGTLGEFQTDANGELSRTTTQFTTRLAVPIFFEKGRHQAGGGPYLLVPDEVVDIEV